MQSLGVCVCVCVCVYVCVVAKLYLTLLQPQLTIARQAPLCMGFLGKKTGVGCHFLLQRIFPTQGSNLHLLQCRILYH